MMSGAGEALWRARPRPPHISTLKSFKTSVFDENWYREPIRYGDYENDCSDDHRRLGGARNTKSSTRTQHQL